MSSAKRPPDPGGPAGERGTAMSRHARWVACLAAALLAVSCSVYKYKELDAKALAAKGRRGRIISIETTGGSVRTFSEKDPVEVKDGAILGTFRDVCWVDPFDISEITQGKLGHHLVLKNGRRFRVAASRVDGQAIQCEAVEPVAFPLDEVRTARVRVKDAAASILGTLGAVVLVVGALALDSALSGDDEDAETPITDGVIEGFFEGSGGGSGGGGDSGRMKSNRALLGATKDFHAAEETEFWTMEWKPLDARPDEDGKLRVRLENLSGVPCGVDEAKLIVVDHSPVCDIAPDILGEVRACPAPVPPLEAVDASGTDVRDLLAASDGRLWRSPVSTQDPKSADQWRSRLTLGFPREKGARWAKLVVNAANSSWRPEFAREIQVAAEAGAPAGAPKKDRTPSRKIAAGPFEEWEFGKLRVQMLTVFGWKTAQLIFTPGPLPGFDLIYELDLRDVMGDKVWLRISPPAGYWLIDRLAIDFSPDVFLEPTAHAPEKVDGPDAAAVLEALGSEDSTTLRLLPGDPPAELTFPFPPAKEGTKRTVFLRTVNCYETRPAKIGQAPGAARP